MDNATFHKKHNIQQVIIDAGYMVEYLPTYSPDLNPIEHKWTQAKSKKRESGCNIGKRLKNDYSQCRDMWQKNTANCYQNNVAWL